MLLDCLLALGSLGRLGHGGLGGFADGLELALGQLADGFVGLQGQADHFLAGGGNLFVVFGEPDIGLDQTAEGYVVRLKGVDIPTLKELGINVTIGNWRGVYGAPGITPAQRKELTDLVLKATKAKSWLEALEKNNWTSAVMAGVEFENFVDDEFASLRAIMVKAGMV